MVKVGVMYANTSGARFDHEYYRNKHMPLVKKGLGTSAGWRPPKVVGQVLAASSSPNVPSPVNA